MLALCLVAAFAMVATTAVIASPAQAACNIECKEQKEKEKQEAKERKASEKEKAAEEKKKAKEQAKGEKEEARGEISALTWNQYKYCPIEDYENIVESYEGNGVPEHEITDCFVGRTNGGKAGGYFEYGGVHVPLSKPIRLQGGFRGAGSEITIVPASKGGETLEAPELPVTGGTSIITPTIQKEAEWPEALVQAFAEAKKAHETAVNVKIELAGNELFEVPGGLDTENLLFEEGTAFRLPLKVKVTAPFLEKLGSGPCYIGSDEHPIMQHLTTSGDGRAGALSFNEEFTNLGFKESQLVDVGWHISPEQGANGCGGAYEQYVDAALNDVLKDGPYQTGRLGITVLTGALTDANAGSVVKKAENHEDELEE